MDYIKLTDGTQITIGDGASLDRIIHISATEADAVAVCAKLTPENLTHVEFATAPDDEPHGVYENLALIEPPTRQNLDEGGVLVVISLREKTAVELRLDALEESQKVQDGAIEDIGTVLSDMAEEA